MTISSKVTQALTSQALTSQALTSQTLTSSSPGSQTAVTNNFHFILPNAPIS